MNDQQIRELAEKYVFDCGDELEADSIAHRFELAIREAISLTRNEVIEECAKELDKNVEALSKINRGDAIEWELAAAGVRALAVKP